MKYLDEFTEEVRDFLNENLTDELRHYGDAYPGHSCPHPVAKEWTRILDKKGWSVPEWPVEHGGTGWSVDKVVAFKRELTLAHAPRLMVQGVDYVGPVVIEFGTEEQKQQYLPRIRSGDDWWAQGFSEPSAGSDLAALQCRAERDGDEYIINGTKIWTTYAHECNKIFCLVRTNNSGKPQAGISFLLFDLDLPGIEIRPIITLEGDHQFNQVFFSDVRVPRSALLGKENEGWTVSKFLLVGERAFSYAATVHVYLEKIRRFVCEANTQGPQLLTNDSALKTKLANAEVDLANLDALEQRMFSLLKTDMAGAAALSSVTKIYGTELSQRVTELAVEMLGPYAAPLQPRLFEQSSLDDLVGPPTAHTAVAVSNYLTDRALTIAGGTTEIQKNVIANRVLGL